MLDVQPNHHDALHLLGLIEQKRGHHDKAIELIEKAIEIHPNNASFYLNLGLVYKNSLQYNQARTYYLKALNIDPKLTKAHLYLGNLLRDQGNIAGASAAFLNASKISPDNADIWYELGRCFEQQRETDQAIRCFQKAIELKPDQVNHYLYLGKAYYESEQYEPAEQALKKADELNPNTGNILEQLGILYYKKGDDARFHEYFERAISLDSNNHHHYHNYGVCHFQAGDIDKAKPLFEKSIEVAPGFAQGYYNYSQVKKFKAKDPAIKAVEELLSNARMSIPDQVECHFALAKMYDDCKQYDNAFDHAETGNNLKAFPYNKEKEHQFIEDLKTIFNQDFIQTLRQHGNTSDQPMFIVGMPRSGTTLAEQILGSHEDVGPRGELSAMIDITKSLKDTASPDTIYPNLMKKANPTLIGQMSDYYLDQIRQHVDPSIKRITDKMPYNAFHLGMVAVLFPNAKIIHCERNPLDTILSIFFQNFRFLQKCGSTLDSMADFYQGYKSVMTHWKTIFPESIFTLNYEDLVKQPEPTIRNLIEFCELPWQESCLKAHKQKSSVKTASIWQVRQPIYTSSVEKWKNYEKHLESIKYLLDL